MSETQAVFAMVIVVLVAVLFVLALAETSLLHVRRSAVAVAAESGDRRTVELMRLLDDLPRVMNAVLLTVLLAQVTAATVAGALARSWFGASGVTAATVLVTILLFVYGEAIPKTLAVRQPLAVARRVARPIQLLSAMLRPVVSVLVRVADLQTRGTGIDAVTEVGEAELRHLADVAASAGQIDEADAELIERSFVFGDLAVRQILVPRTAVVAVSARASVAEALATAVAAGHRRLPVYEGDLDEIVGFVKMRDLAAVEVLDPDAAVVSLAQEAIAVPESKKVLELLRLMQRSGRHLAVVVDEHGGTDGIVTIEDVVEELVGSIDEP